MNPYNDPSNFDVPPASIQQWQWEESVNSLRRATPESTIRAHWTTTGTTAIDATARAHIAEWNAIDVQSASGDCSVPIIDALVHRALQSAFWDLYVVERHHGATMTVRRLRDQRGMHIRWLEGRTAPAVESVVACRIVYLDPPGLWASTLPLVFGPRTDTDELVPALFRSFGDHRSDHWSTFMRGPGARIILEYALEHLRQRADAGDPRPFDERLVRLDRAFGQLEDSLAVRGRFDVDEATIDGGRVAWIEDVAPGPHLLVFENHRDLQHYRRHLAQTDTPSAARPRIPHCRIYRAGAEQLSSVEHALAGLAGLRPTRDGLVRLRRENGDGQLVDPRGSDVRAVESACRRLAEIHRRRAA